VREVGDDGHVPALHVAPDLVPKLPHGSIVAGNSRNIIRHIDVAVRVICPHVWTAGNLGVVGPVWTVADVNFVVLKELLRIIHFCDILSVEQVLNGKDCVLEVGFAEVDHDDQLVSLD